MVWLSSSLRKPLGAQTERMLQRKDIICIHTMVGFLYSTEQMFLAGGYKGTESHFGIGGKWGSDRDRGLDGVVWQWQDTDYEADANLEGAHRVLSIETADNAPRLPEDILLWTPKQERAIVDLIVELCIKYDIPPVLIPDTKPGRRGLAYHAQGCSPNVVNGGERWSTSAGKVCPGPARIRQFKNVIIPAVQRKLSIGELIDMEWTDKVALTETDARVWTEHAKASGSASTYKKGDLVKISDMIRYPTLARKIELRLIRIEAALNKKATNG